MSPPASGGLANGRADVGVAAYRGMKGVAKSSSERAARPDAPAPLRYPLPAPADAAAPAPAAAPAGPSASSCAGGAAAGGVDALTNGVHAVHLGPTVAAETREAATVAVGAGNDGGGGGGAASEEPKKKAPYYPDYLALDELLACQRPLSFAAGDPHHDEMLFITIHQTYELWFKQIIFELDSVRRIFAELSLGEKKISLALHRLSRIREIQKILVDQISVLETMTPQEFLDFRDYLFPASGFQSFQFRLIEIKLGVRPEQRLNGKWIKNVSPEHQALLRKVQAEPSLFDYVERWLRHIPFRDFRGYSFPSAYETAVDRMFTLDRTNLERQLSGDDLARSLDDLERTRYTFESVYKRDVHEKMIATGARRLGFRATHSSLMIMLYQDEPMLQLPARLLHVLVDVDEQLNQWRYRHSQMVHRMIGIKVGTGGTLGHGYLRATVDNNKVFSDIANLSTLLIPRRLLPELPAELRDQLKYFHQIEAFDRQLFESGGTGEDLSFC
ncbi:hypothetical protein BU14_0720s0003 [Porphyra umbilicalis]|uniref:Tryptophan 2,3-dioxygenase n=1 Tax=Porphyra umbilicalis TaxID=2786 RepID=A0A1X6NQB3_PORUM|nr:hypothetical protein BU14_0720s0003 [Porphyra umbilicalis]|eukprot:OSX70563.1 hypothetical protein BU14_0720s0003 [Porphyra umbilicalis]